MPIGYRGRVTDSELPIRVATPEDFEAVDAHLTRTFHGSPDPDLLEIERGVFEPERSLIAADDDEVVAHAAAFTREMTVPGAVLPAAHVTMVGVAPTHRRRGLLTRLMRRQLREVREEGRETFAALWASEAPIYPRFGYGLAATRLSMEIGTREVTLRPDWQQPTSAVGRLRSGLPATLRKELETVYEHLRPERPGWSSRSDAWWQKVLADTEHTRRGLTERRAIVLDGDSGPRGYATYRTKSDWSTAGPKGEVHIDAAMAIDPSAYAALWEFLLNIDLTRTATYRYAAVDEPLLHLVADPGRLGAQVTHALWVRLIDLEAALAARRYAATVDVVIEVHDALLPENSGRWRLTGDQDGAACAPTGAAADLVCDVRDLGAAYLGGTSLAALAAAGRVRELRPGALLAASAAFGWHRAPSSIEIF
jgi:predicted acetyltransferase